MWRFIKGTIVLNVPIRPNKINYLFLGSAGQYLQLLEKIKLIVAWQNDKRELEILLGIITIVHTKPGMEVAEYNSRLSTRKRKLA